MAFVDADSVRRLAILGIASLFGMLVLAASGSWSPAHVVLVPAFVWALLRAIQMWLGRD